MFLTETCKFALNVMPKEAIRGREKFIVMALIFQTMGFPLPLASYKALYKLFLPMARAYSKKIIQIVW